MSFLRRILGGGAKDGPDGQDARPAPTAAELLEEDQARDRELMRAEAERTSDELIQRQMRYADRAWTPPAQGGERRSDDSESDDD